MLLGCRPSSRAIREALHPCVRRAASIYLSPEVIWRYVMAMALFLPEKVHRQCPRSPHYDSRRGVVHLLLEFATLLQCFSRAILGPMYGIEPAPRRPITAWWQRPQRHPRDRPHHQAKRDAQRDPSAPPPDHGTHDRAREREPDQRPPRHQYQHVVQQIWSTLACAVVGAVI